MNGLQEERASGDLALMDMDLEQLRQAYLELQEQKLALEMRVRKGEERRRALTHILSDLNTLNRKLADQRKAMIHILADYEKDSRNAMIHIMSDLRETTEAVQKREQELREKQEQLVQAGKLATLGELTTGVAHELNNPLNNIGLFIGNAIDLIELGTPSSIRSIALPMKRPMLLSGLFNSCAKPVVSSPSVASFPACTNCSCFSRNSCSRFCTASVVSRRSLIICIIALRLFSRRKLDWCESCKICSKARRELSRRSVCLARLRRSFS